MPSKALFAVAALLALGGAGCQVVPQSSQASTGATPAPAPATTSAPAPGPAPRVPERTQFSFSGELTQGGWIRGTAPSGTRTLTLGGEAVAVASDGSFFAAFDRDAPGAARLVATLDDGEQVVRDIQVAPRGWNIERVNVARRSGGPSAAFMERRRPELARINAAREINAESDGWRQTFIWPVKGRISGRFGSQRIYRGEPGSYHSGIDITTGESGTPFVAPADGVVVLATEQPFSLEGYLLIIDHGNGLNSAFLHNSRIAVREGQAVKQGQYIGNIGSSGRATGPHLHWGLKWNSARLDPLLLAGPM